MSLIEEVEMLTGKEKDLKASGLFKSPILAACAFFADLHGSDPLVELAPNPDQNSVAREVAERSPSAPSGFVNLMFPLRCSPAIQRANKVHSAPQTTVHAFAKQREFRHWSDVLSTLFPNRAGCLSTGFHTLYHSR